jgi:hypothetical protein
MSRHRAVRNLDLEGINWIVSLADGSVDYLDDDVDDNSYDDEVQGFSPRRELPNGTNCS